VKGVLSMAKVLVTAGNVFDPTFDGVCYAVREIIGGVKAVHIFDTTQSAEHAEQGQRSTRIRDILGTVDITTSLIDETNLQEVIPDRIAQLIRNFGTDEIVIDLSNGQKITASVLYAVSTISRINQIYALEFHAKITKEAKVWDLTYDKDWTYTRIHPLREIMNITQSSYVELIYYRDRIESVTSAIEAKNHVFALDAKDRLEHSLVDYFTLSVSDSTTPERLERCVNGLGKICEDIASIWHKCCQREAIITTQANDFNAQVKQIISKWSEYRKQAATSSLDTTDGSVVQIVIPTLAIDTHLEAMRVYRNLASHSKRYYYYTKQDARLALDLTLLLLERLSQSEVFSSC
jgi:hypothetical protein